MAGKTVLTVSTSLRLVLSEYWTGGYWLVWSGQGNSCHDGGTQGLFCQNTGGGWFVTIGANMLVMSVFSILGCLLVMVCENRLVLSKGVLACQDRGMQACQDRGIQACLVRTLDSRGNRGLSGMLD